MGRPVIGSNVGDMDVIIHNGENGLIYTAGNKAELIDCLIRLADPALRLKLGQNGVTTAQKLSWDSIVVKLVDTISQTL